MSNKDLLDKAAKAYYEGMPFLSDEEFDRLAEAADYEPVGYNLTLNESICFRYYHCRKFL